MQFITTYLTANVDPQRGCKWESKSNDLYILSTSIECPVKRGLYNTMVLTVIHDEPISPHVSKKQIKVKPLGNPYFARWEHILNHLPDEGFVCLLDATDTEVLRVPKGLKKNTLYVGHEQSIIGCDWMRSNFSTEYLLPFIDSNQKKQLLNCGVVIGHVDIVREFLNSMLEECVNDVGVMEMGIFNKVIYERFDGRFQYGNHITTQFKQYETENKTAWIRHK